MNELEIAVENNLGFIDPNNWTPFELFAVGLVLTVLVAILIVITWQAAFARGSRLKRMCWASSAFLVWMGVAGFVYLSISSSISAGEGISMSEMPISSVLKGD